MNVNRKKRLVSARKWIGTYSGKNIVKGYSKKFAVDKRCAIKELRLIGVEISREYEEQVIKSINIQTQTREAFKKQNEDELFSSCEFESNEDFSMIIGYTSNGFPYGLTHNDTEIKINKVRMPNRLV